MNKTVTYGDLYDGWLEELYQPELDRIQPLRGCSVSKLIKESAPTDYRCGFSDWLDGLTEFTCPECQDRDVDSDSIHDAGSEDVVQCKVCAGTHFECQGCGELKPAIEEVAFEGSELCNACYEEAAKESGDDPEEEDEDA